MPVRRLPGLRRFLDGPRKRLRNVLGVRLLALLVMKEKSGFSLQASGFDL
jgi:hypothetical protein